MLPRFAPERNQARLALDDSSFLARLRSMDLAGLESALLNHSHKGTPRWKRVAIRRAISRLSPRPYAWILGLEEAMPRIEDGAVAFDDSGVKISPRSIALCTLDRIRAESAGALRM